MANYFMGANSGRAGPAIFPPTDILVLVHGAAVFGGHRSSLEAVRSAGDVMPLHLYQHEIHPRLLRGRVCTNGDGYHPPSGPPRDDDARGPYAAGGELGARGAQKELARPPELTPVPVATVYAADHWMPLRVHGERSGENLGGVPACSVHT